MKKRCALIYVLILATTEILSGQNTSGTLVGHVTDSSGAAVVGATVTIRNTNTAEDRTLSTDTAGDYTAPLLKPGNYQVVVAENGFKTETQAGIVLNVGQTVRTDISLAVGQIAESVTVFTATPAIDTDSAEVGQVISAKQITDLPLNGRNFQDLLFLAPGAVNNAGGEQSSYRIVISGGSNSSISLGGARGSSNGYTVDGTSILDIGYDTPAFAPSLDDISEFKEQTKSYSAAYGYSANQVNVSSKSGTNNFHGTAFEFLRNTAADGTPHGSKPGVTIPLLHRNQFGFALGGPVRIPHLYNGRDKTFFFANYEGFRQLVGGGSEAFIPLPDELKGIFSPAVLGRFTAQSATTQCGVTYHVGDPHPLFDPQTGCPFPADASGNFVIPSTRISRLGQLAQRPGLYFPAAPNINAPFGQNNYAINAASVLNFDQQNYRIDHNFSGKDSIFFHAVIHNENQSSGALTPVSGQVVTQPGRLYTLTETHLFSPTFSNQFRIGYLEATHRLAPQLAISKADLALINFPNSFSEPGEGYPRLEFDASPLNNGVVYSGAAFFNAPSFSVQPVWDLGESAIYSWRRHTISFGFGIRRIHLDLQNGGGLGRLSFNGQFSGDSFADLLLGATSNLGLSQVAPLTNPATGPTPHLRFMTWAPYVQDDWKVSQRLTLNLGLRYEYTAVPYEEQNFFIWPDFNAPGGAIYVANKTIVNNYGGTNPFGSGGLYLSPPNGLRGPGPANKNDLLPRLGFAFRPFNTNKTVVRGGYGIFFDTIEANEYQASTNFYPLSTGVTTTGIPLTYPPTYNTDSLPTATAAGPVTSFATNSGSPLGFLQIQPNHTEDPYVMSWNFGVEQELPGQTTLEVDYVGNKGTHLFSRSNPNQPTQCIPSNGCTVTATTPPSVPVKARTPFPNLGTLVYGGFNGYSNYNALDVKVEHRSSDLTLLAAYTWSKELDVKSAVAGFSGDNAGWAGPQNSHDFNAEYARGSFDVGQRLALSVVYNLPVGRGKRVLGNAPRLLDAAIGGWEVGFISSFQGGLPFTIGAADVQGANNTFAERADQVLPGPAPGFQKSTHGEQGGTWFSTAQFAQPAPGLFGNSSRDAIRAPGQINFDASMFKNFNFTERVQFQLRGDAFNVLNHWNPGQPDSNVNDGSNYGKIFATNSQNSARILQIGARISF